MKAAYIYIYTYTYVYTYILPIPIFPVEEKQNALNEIRLLASVQQENIVSSTHLIINMYLYTYIHTYIHTYSQLVHPKGNQ